jgi:16S rRNA (guanine527-N7)-methyltransferase
MSLAERLRSGLAAMDLKLDATVQDHLLVYLSLLAKWNKTYNLTAIHEPERMLTHHLLDSLALLPYVHAERLLDVGSGAGLPGIPLALARSATHVTMIDASNKKATFMRQAIIELGLKNAVALHVRVEDLRPEAPFGQIVSRAFSDLSEFVRLSGHLLAQRGEWLAMKGLYPNEELVQLKDARLKADHRLRVPELDAERHLIVLEAA